MWAEPAGLTWIRVECVRWRQTYESSSEQGRRFHCLIAQRSRGELVDLE